MPYFYAMYFLSWIKGPLVNNWKNDQVEDLKNKTTRAQNWIVQIEPALWNKLKAAFTTAFTDTAKVQNAYFKLMNYYQCNDSIDTYILTFRHLAKATGYLPNATTTIDIFLKYLDRRLLAKILDQKTEPIIWLDGKKQPELSIREPTRKQSCCNCRNMNGILLHYGRMAGEETDTPMRTCDPMSLWM